MKTCKASEAQYSPVLGIVSNMECGAFDIGNRTRFLPSITWHTSGEVGPEDVEVSDVNDLLVLDTVLSIRYPALEDSERRSPRMF